MSTQKRYFIHRSGTETLWTCPRKYMLEYLYKGTGIRLAPTKIQLVVGSAVHVGLACLCDVAKVKPEYATQPEVCAGAVVEAVDYFRQSDTFQHLKRHEQLEQETLIAGLLWAFFYQSWEAFVRTYEVVCVERAYTETWTYTDDMPEFVLSSRPDVIVRHKLTNEFIGISWKTIDDLTEYKRWNYRENLQNMLETYYGEKLLSQILEEEFVLPASIMALRGRHHVEAAARAIEEFRSLPREIAYVQTIFLVKGTRVCETLDGQVITWEEGEEYTEQERTWRQQSFLCYRYVNGGMPTTAEGDLEETLLESLKPRGRKNPAPKSRKVNLSHDVSWSYRYWQAKNKSYNNLSGDWMRQPLWECDTPLQEWVQALKAGSVFPSTGLNDDRNEVNPLSKVVIWDAPVERNEALMVKTVEEVEQLHYEAVRRGFADGVLTHEGWQRSLNACHNSAPSAGVSVRCEFLTGDVCYSPEVLDLVQIKAPLEGQFKEWVHRVPHHEIERQSFEERGILA